VLPFQSFANGAGSAVTITGQPITTLPANAATALAQGTQPVSNVELVTDPGEWTLTSAPAAATIASAVRGAVAGVKHILKSIQGSLQATVAQATPVTVEVLDGATVIWQDRLIAPAGFNGCVSVTGLNLAGTTGNSMTVQVTPAPAATNFVTVSGSGYDTQ
jgi:type IV secretory pathway protease TraF